VQQGLHGIAIIQAYFYHPFLPRDVLWRLEQFISLFPARTGDKPDVRYSHRFDQGAYVWACCGYGAFQAVQN
jgi:hypothetical protein